MAKKLALGKGIASLLQDTSTPKSIIDRAHEKLMQDMEEDEAPAIPRERIIEKTVVKIENAPLLIAITSIKTNPAQPRKIFKDKDLEELAESIKENGIIQPLIVAELENGQFELIAGERRLRAAKRAGLEQVPVVVKRGTEREKMIMSIIENVQRSDLNCVEEALAYHQLMNEYKLTQEEVAKKLGKERSSIANFLRILHLPRPVLELLQKELLSFGHAKVLVSAKEKEDAIRLANECVQNNWSVRELEKAMKAKKPNAEKENINGANPFFNEKLDQFKNLLQQKTGYHFDISAGKNGGGQIMIKYSNEAEFNDIYEYLVKR